MEDNKNNINEEVKDQEEVITEEEVIETPDEVLEENIDEMMQEEDNEDQMMFEMLRKLQDENKLLGNQVSTFQDKLVKQTAEYENFRKRTIKEKEQIYTDSCADVLKEILPVIDNLDRALMAITEESELRKGVEMTLKQFEMTLEKLNVEVIDTTGQFDPNMHEAIMHVVDEAYEEKAIVEVFQKGYKRGDKVIRYSMVKVAN